MLAPRTERSNAVHLVAKRKACFTLLHDGSTAPDFRDDLLSGGGSQNHYFVSCPHLSTEPICFHNNRAWFRFADSISLPSRTRSGELSDYEFIRSAGFSGLVDRPYLPVDWNGVPPLPHGRVYGPARCSTATRRFAVADRHSTRFPDCSKSVVGISRLHFDHRLRGVRPRLRRRRHVSGAGTAAQDPPVAVHLLSFASVA